MKLFKRLLAGVALAAATVTTHAAMINVGGVTWDPDAPGDFSGMWADISQYIISPSGELTGFGKITKINASTTFCSGCELTFEYGGYLPVTAGALPTTTGTIGYTNGWVKMYVDSTPDAPEAMGLNQANATDGVLWLDLVGHALDGVTLTQTKSNTGTLGGDGLWDVIGGLAQGNLNTNTEADGADLMFTMSYTDFRTPLISSGTGNLHGNSIPEPGSLLLLGLGLLGVASARARKKI